MSLMTDILGTEKKNVAQILKNKRQKSMAKKLTFKKHPNRNRLKIAKKKQDG